MNKYKVHIYFIMATILEFHQFYLHSAPIASIALDGEAILYAVSLNGEVMKFKEKPELHYTTVG